MVEISKGAASESVPFGGEIKTEEPVDIMEKVNGIAKTAEVTMEKIQSATTSLADEGLHRDIRGSMASIRVVLDQLATGPGYPHKFLTDPEEAARISRAISSLDRAAGELNTTLVEVRHVVARVKEGPGFTHDVIYGDGPKAEIAQFGSAAEEVASTLKGIQQSDSFAHGLLYGGKGQGAGAVDDVTAMTSDLRAIVADTRAGKGTLGALLVDPSIYEDLKGILGNVQRNDVLRALVRYSIKHDEQKPKVKVEPSTHPK
jgi:phospholipid/cholesterol/gamma-HCH transport system substrate-binding protein